MKTFTLARPRGFRLGAAAEFYASFTPGSGMAAADAERLTLTFRLDRTFEAVGVTLREEGDVLVAELAGSTDDAAAGKQLSRMLGLEGDADAWQRVGEREPVVGMLQREYPGFFTAAKSSPYDAATWSVIAPRMNMPQAARVKMAMARELGDAVEVRGRVHHVFPSPAVLTTLEAFPGLAAQKVERLRGVAEAALAGRLDSEALRALGEERALAQLQTLPGVGPWSAGHIYFRGAAPPDALPTVEPRVLHGLALAYGLEAPTTATLQRIAEGWRPFRMWVCVLLARHLAQSAAWHAPGLARERVVAGRALAGVNGRSERRASRS